VTSLSVKNLSDRCLWGILLFCTVYESYRYPLQMSFTGTSPTYSNTPLVIQLGKFLVTVLVCLITVPGITKRVLPIRKWTLVVLEIWMAGYLIFKAFIMESGDRSSYLIAAFWPIAALVIVLSADEVTVDALDRYFRFVLIYALGSTALQVFLFLAIGRLPALGYPNSFSVRFGGFLDDPNAFSVLLYMLIGWVYYRFSGIKRFALEAALVLCVLITQSLTAIGFLALLTLLFVGYHLIRRPKPILLISIAAIFAVILSFIWSPLVDIVTGVMETKSGSVDTHLSQVGLLQGDLGLWWLFGAPSLQIYESWWTGSPVNFGFPWFLICFGVVATLAFSGFRALRKAQSSRHKAVIAGIFMLSCYFTVGCTNLPFFQIFPANFVFFFFAYLVFFDRIKEPVPQTAKAPLAPMALA
jgi:hypothetical protein